MKPKKILLSIIFLAVLTVFISCKHDKNHTGNDSSSNIIESQTTIREHTQSQQSLNSESFSEKNTEVFSRKDESDSNAEDYSEKFSGLEVESDLVDEGFGEFITVPGR